MYCEVFSSMSWNPINWGFVHTCDWLLKQFLIPVLNQKRECGTVCFRRQKQVSLSLFFWPNHVYKTFTGICLCIHAPKAHTVLLEYMSVLVVQSSSSFPYAQVCYCHNHFFNMSAIILKLLELFKEARLFNFFLLSRKSWLSSWVDFNFCIYLCD